MRNEPLPERSRGTTTDFSQPGNERSVWNWIWFHDGSRDDEKGYREERERRRGGGGGGKRGQEVSLSFPLQRSPFPIPGLFARFFRFLALRGTMRGDEKADQPRFLFSVERLGSLLRENRHRFLEQHHRRNVPVSRSIHRSKNGRPISREFRGGERLNLKLNLRRDRVTFILFDHFGNTIDVRKEK